VTANRITTTERNRTLRLIETSLGRVGRRLIVVVEGVSGESGAFGRTTSPCEERLPTSWRKALRPGISLGEDGEPHKLLLPDADSRDLPKEGPRDETAPYLGPAVHGSYGRPVVGIRKALHE
jgi:hypothetical protein